MDFRGMWQNMSSPKSGESSQEANKGSPTSSQNQSAVSATRDPRYTTRRESPKQDLYAGEVSPRSQPPGQFNTSFESSASHHSSRNKGKTVRNQTDHTQSAPGMRGGGDDLWQSSQAEGFSADELRKMIRGLARAVSALDEKSDVINMNVQGVIGEVQGLSQMTKETFVRAEETRQDNVNGTYEDLAEVKDSLAAARNENRDALEQAAKIAQSDMNYLIREADNTKEDLAAIRQENRDILDILSGQPATLLDRVSPDPRSRASDERLREENEALLNELQDLRNRYEAMAKGERSQAPQDSGKTNDMSERYKQAVKDNDQLKSLLDNLSDKYTRSQTVQETEGKEVESLRAEMQALQKKYNELEEDHEYDQETLTNREEHIDELKKLLARERAASRRQFEKLQDYQGKIRVVARIRPVMSHDESEDVQDFGEQIPGEFTGSWAQFAIPEEQPSARGSRTVLREQEMERIFGPETTNGDVFEELEFLISTGLAGSQCAIFAYGPSGTGKTHTLSAISGTEPDGDNDGVMPQTLALAFRHAEENQHRWTFKFSLSAVEIYMEELFDLTSSPPRKITVARDAQPPSVEIKDYKQAMQQLTSVLSKRRASSTAVHDKSSRSHLIFSLRVVRKPVDVVSGPEAWSNKSRKPSKEEGCIHICDLAGSEKIADTATDLQKKEGVNINSSLSDLLTVLAQLGAGNTPTPSSALGKTLRSCFEKSGRVVMLNLLSPLKSDYQRLTRPTLEKAQQVHKSRNIKANIRPASSPRTGTGEKQPYTPNPVLRPTTARPSTGSGRPSSSSGRPSTPVPGSAPGVRRTPTTGGPSSAASSRFGAPRGTR